MLTIINEKSRPLKKKVQIWVVLNSDGVHVGRFFCIRKAASVARRIDGQISVRWALA